MPKPERKQKPARTTVQVFSLEEGRLKTRRVDFQTTPSLSRLLHSSR
ncbi:hypothetical protein MCC93_22070 [Morococcus cerebrosus]|uniref:Uncharacterized protein n=1 Tax=Morococcus cerebrosus TaxID=1056807 RepID=A0A0C1GIE1_9NEIS|nr:hypothetical protein MCC93_22070 [Morococcus cerebrosus]